MTTRNLIVGVAALIGASAFAQPSVLLVGQVEKQDSQRSVVTGGAKAIIKDGTDEMTLTAQEIAFDPTSKLLTCKGDVAIRIRNCTVAARDIKIDLGRGNPLVYVLNPEGVRVEPTSTSAADPAIIGTADPAKPAAGRTANMP